MPETYQFSDQEDALQAVMALYAPAGGDMRPYSERRALAIKAVVEQAKTWDSGRRSMIKRVLRVEQLVAAGQIQRPAVEPPSEACVSETAKGHYVQAVRADPRLASRLLRRVGESCPLQEGENLEEYFVRLAETDFSKGFDECDFPQLHSAAVESARSAHSIAMDSDGVVDEEQVLREDIALLDQALELALRSEERFFGVAMALPELPAGDDDGIDAEALVLALGVETGEGMQQRAHERPRG